jgi:hypothetical protein
MTSPHLPAIVTGRNGNGKTRVAETDQVVTWPISSGRWWRETIG